MVSNKIIPLSDFIRKKCMYQAQLLKILSFVTDYGYGHPGAFSPFLLNPGWLDAAYLNYAWVDYFRPPQMRDTTNALVKGNVS